MGANQISCAPGSRQKGPARPGGRGRAGGRRRAHYAGGPAESLARENKSGARGQVGGRASVRVLTGACRRDGRARPARGRRWAARIQTYSNLFARDRLGEASGASKPPTRPAERHNDDLGWNWAKFS